MTREDRHMKRLILGLSLLLAACTPALAAGPDAKPTCGVGHKPTCPPPTSTTPPPTTPPPGCVGIQVTTASNVQGLIDSNPEGTTFCFAVGTYNLTAGYAPKSFDRLIGQAGVILDGNNVSARGITGSGGPTGQHDITVQDMHLREFTGSAIHAGWAWNVLNNEIELAQIGIEVNNDIKLRGGRIHHNAQYGINGGPGLNFLIEGVELDHNNTSNNCGGACNGNAGGSKLIGGKDTPAGLTGLTWRNNNVHDNTGVGIWSDGNVHDALYEGNTITGNTEVGLFHEISWNAIIRNNTFSNNGSVSAGMSCWWGSQLHLNNSQGVEIYGNTLTSTNNANGICLVDATRSEPAAMPQFLANVSVHDNNVQMGSTANTGLVGNGTNSSSVTFNFNHYTVPSLSGLNWAWFDQYPLTWGQFRARGQEADGTVVVG